ncbi:hypothetical protein BKA57DRAFT_466593 [Linnemannia elongata]|nr:hypothetical protein BKA57DRAFT_466593 [Linnemannia elongata]
MVFLPVRLFEVFACMLFCSCGSVAKEGEGQPVTIGTKGMDTTTHPWLGLKKKLFLHRPFLSSRFSFFFRREGGRG